MPPKRKQSWIPVTVAIGGPLIVFFLLLVLSTEVARRTPVDQLPVLTTPETAAPDYQLYLTVVTEEAANGAPIAGTRVQLERTELVDGATEPQQLTTPTDSSGMATFSIPKRGELTVTISDWTVDGDPPKQSIPSLENHPDEMMVLRFQRATMEP